MKSPTAEPMRYTPFGVGKYLIVPGLKFLDGANFFELNRLFSLFRENKLRARKENLLKYYVTSNYNDPVPQAINRFIIDRLVHEYPEFFSRDDSDGLALHCELTGETLRFSREGQYLEDYGYVSGLDALACQIQEDLAVTTVEPTKHWLSALHLCAPNGWSAEKKIGKSFSAIHAPVAGFKSIRDHAADHVKAMVHGTSNGTFRFAWGITTDDNLDRHPLTSEGNHFDPKNPRAFVRVERQTFYGLPKVGASLFAIGTSFIDIATLTGELRAKLRTAVEKMTPASQEYKDISSISLKFLQWLASSEE